MLSISDFFFICIIAAKEICSSFCFFLVPLIALRCLSIGWHTLIYTFFSLFFFNCDFYSSLQKDKKKLLFLVGSPVHSEQSIEPLHSIRVHLRTISVEYLEGSRMLQYHWRGAEGHNQSAVRRPSICTTVRSIVSLDWTRSKLVGSLFNPLTRKWLKSFRTPAGGGGNELRSEFSVLMWNSAFMYLATRTPQPLHQLTSWTFLCNTIAYLIWISNECMQFLTFLFIYLFLEFCC